MSDNNADFNGTGQVNNPTSDNAAQADYNQPYIPQQNDAQMNHPESQPETPAYDQNSAAYTQPAQPAEPAVPAYSAQFGLKVDGIVGDQTKEALTYPRKWLL